MLFRANITKFIIVLIVLAVVLVFLFSGQVPSKATKAANSSPASVKVSDTNLAIVNKPTSRDDVKATAAKLELNSYVLKIIPTYREGKYPYLLNDDYEHYNGVTENIVYKDTLIAKANPDNSKSSHCVGLTYEVFFKAMEERNKEAGISLDNFNNMTIENMKDFLLTWYAAKGSPKSEGNQLAGAIVKYGLGTQVTKLEDVKAGDFIDFSRTKSGHTAVFISWLKDDEGKILGFKYWSTQDSTNGIGYKVEYFSDNPPGSIIGTIDRSQLYIGRVGAVENYKSF